MTHELRDNLQRLVVMWDRNELALHPSCSLDIAAELSTIMQCIREEVMHD